MAYSGAIVTIPLGKLGLLTDAAPSEIPPEALIDARNISFSSGYLSKAPGSLLYNTSPLSAGIVALFDYWPDASRQRLIAVTSDGSVYRDIGDRTFSGGIPINTELGQLTPNCIFVQAGAEAITKNRKLFLFTEGRNQLKVLEGDGTSFRDVNNPSVDWVSPNYPSVGVLHRNRLWAFQGQRVYASSATDHEDFNSASSLADVVFPGEGREIIGAFVFKGRLFCYKAGGFVYYLEDSSFNSSDWYWKKISNSVGVSAPNATVEIINDFLMGNTTGTITSFSATQKFGDIEAGDIFRQLQVENYIRSNFNKSGVEQMHALFYSEKQQVFFTYRSTYKPNNDMLLVLDMSSGNTKLSAWTKGSPQCLALRRDINRIFRPIYGDDQGYVHLMDREDRSEGGQAYEGSFQTPHLDFRFADPSFGQRQKHFDFLALEFIEQGPHNVFVDVFIDGKFIETIQIPQQETGVYLDSFLLDTDRLSQQASHTITVPLHGTGRRISFRVYNNGLNENFQIASYTVCFRPAGSGSSRF